MDDVIDKCLVCLTDAPGGIALFNAQNEEYLKELNRILETELTEDLYWLSTLCSSCKGTLDQVRRLKDTFRSTQNFTVKICVQEEPIVFEEFTIIDGDDDPDVIELVEETPDDDAQIMVVNEPEQPRPAPLEQTDKSHREAQRRAAVEALRELGVLPCYICKKEFDEYVELHNHMLNVHSCRNSFFVCCNRKINLWKAGDHLEFHNQNSLPNKKQPNGPEEVDMALENFEENLRKKRASAEQAMRELGVFHCPICKEISEDFMAMDKHMLGVHKRPKSYFVCCNRKISLWMACNHLRFHRSKSKPQCEYCGRTFTDLKTHTMRCLKAEKPFKCGQCPFAAITKGELKVHVRCVHDKIYGAVCDICGAKFKQAGQLKIHTDKVHSGKPSEPCRFCGKYLFDLKKHEKRCRAEKVACEICGTLVAELEIKNHIANRHKNVKNYPCEFCGKVFRVKGNYKDHVDGVHKGIRVRCLFCDHSSTSRKNTENHMKLKHKKKLQEYRAKKYEETFGKPRYRTDKENDTE